MEVPREQTCSGRPACNGGDRAITRDLARGILEAFGVCDHVVVPSGSCGGMIKHRLPHPFDGDPHPRARADTPGACTHGPVRFLTDVMGTEGVQASHRGAVT